MTRNPFRPRCLRKVAKNCVAILCCTLLVSGEAMRSAQEQTPASGQQETVKIPPDQLDSLVAPIALYPDPMLAQVLAASTYPLEIMQLQQWLTKNKSLKDKALVDAVSKQPWDPSVQGLAALPEVVKRLADDIQWATDLGNAFLAQQTDVMDAVQRMRKKAKDAGNLKSTEQQKVETKVVESKQVVVIEQSNPQVVYVPSYNPVVVYGPPAYPYPPITYPPPGYYAAGMAISFGVGLAMGAAWGGGWGYGSNWGNNNVNVNVNNNFNRNTNVQGGNRVSTQPARGSGGNGWQHNPQHRGGTPYSDRSTANRYGGTTRGASVSDRQANARRNQGQGGNRAQAGSRPNQGQLGGQPRASDRSSGGAGDRGGDRASAGGGDRGGDRASAGGADRGGNRGGSSGAGASSKGTALGGGSSGRSGSSARASSSRGSSSMGSRSGGSRGGGGGGGRRR
jgi:Protein of unknown function (DUF3300)